MERASHNFRQSLKSTAQRLGLTTFWRWWVGQLAPLLPAAPRAALSRRRLRPIVAFESDTAVVWAPRVTNGVVGFTETARIPLSADPVAVAREGHAAIDALPRAIYGGPVTEARVVVGLPASQVLRKTLTLPAAVEENLHQMLEYDLDRHTPFKPDEMYFDAIVVGRIPAKKEIEVDWSAALKIVVDQARRRAESWGATVVGVTPDPPPGAAALALRSLNLLPPSERPDISVWRRWQIWLPVILIIVSVLVAVVLPVWQKRGYAIALAQLTEQGRAQADASSALRDQLEQLTGDYNFALQRKYAFPAAIQVVDDVTRLLPDDTWLTQLEMKTTARGKDPRREIVLRGESANAGRLVSLLEESKVFGEAAPRSPTTKIQPGPGEIFDLGAQLKPLPPPPMIELAGTSGGDTAPASPALQPMPPASADAAPASPGSGAAPGSPAGTATVPGGSTQGPAGAPAAAMQSPAGTPAAMTQSPAGAAGASAEGAAPAPNGAVSGAANAEGAAAGETPTVAPGAPRVAPSTKAAR